MLSLRELQRNYFARNIPLLHMAEGLGNTYPWECIRLPGLRRPRPPPGPGCRYYPRQDRSPDHPHTRLHRLLVFQRLLLVKHLRHSHPSHECCDRADKAIKLGREHHVSTKER